jgi:hypothetical protein
MVSIIAPITLVAAALAPNVYMFILCMMTFTVCTSPLDTLTDARFYRVPTELAARIAEIRGLIDGTVKSLVWLLLSWTLLACTQSGRAAMGVCAVAGLILSLAICFEALRASVSKTTRRSPRLGLASPLRSQLVAAIPIVHGVNCGCITVSTAELPDQMDEKIVWSRTLW